MYFCFETTSRRIVEITLEQFWVLKFCTKLDKKTAETHELLKQACGESALSYMQVTRWIKNFRECQEVVDDDNRSGRPSTSQIDENVICVRELLNSDRRMSVRLLILCTFRKPLRTN